MPIKPPQAPPPRGAAAGPVSLEGIVERVTFESAASSYRVIKLAVAGRAERLAVVGSFPPTPVGARVRVRGLLEQDHKHGEQLRVESLIELAPDTLAGLEKYLASGLIKGVGPKLAQRIVATFGLDALRVLDEETDRLREVEGLGGKRRDGSRARVARAASAARRHGLPAGPRRELGARRAHRAQVRTRAR